MAFSRITAAILGLCLAGVNAASAETRRLDIVGTGDGIDVLRVIAASFMQQEGSPQIEVPPSIGSGGGIAAVGSGKAILGRVARRLTDAEAASGIVYKEIARACPRLSSSIPAVE
ncbi:ABC-type phosphate transport system substrate-binding protein [Bradyrhizobium diazoefficiens]